MGSTRSTGPRIEAIGKRSERKLEHMKRGDELPSGVLEMVKVYRGHEAEAGRGRQDGRPARQQGRHRPHPAEEDMPFLEDGTPVDILS